MNTKMWGPPTWRFLEGVAERYPGKTPSFSDQVAFTLFFRALGRSLPCVYCRQSFFCFLRKRPLSPALREGRRALHDWLYTVHNDVNAKLEKPVLDLETARRIGREKLLPKDLAEFRQSASVFLFANAYNYPEEPPADSKTEDFYRLWTDVLPAINDAMPDHPLGDLRGALARHRLTEEILQHRSTVVDWVLTIWQDATGDQNLPARPLIDRVFDVQMRAGKRQCLDAARGTPGGPGAGAGGACH